MLVKWRNSEYRVLREQTPEQLRPKYSGIAARMIANNVSKQLEITNPKYPIKYDPRGQPDNIMIVYLKNGVVVGDIEG